MQKQMGNASQEAKMRLGAIGENNVVLKLMEHGWDAFNANCTIKNYKSVDIVCVNGDKKSIDKPWQPETAFIQVKTSFQTNIPAGFTIGQCLDKAYLQKNVMGPYVFVHVRQLSDMQFDYRYFIISRENLIELLHQAHVYYVYGYHRDKKEGSDVDLRKNGVLLNSPAGLYVRWLEGKSDVATKKHIAFVNPLNGVTTEGKWENIWNI